MAEGDMSGKNEHNGIQIRGFMTDGETMGICIVLAREMTKTGKGTFIVRAPADNDINPDTGYLYPDDQVKMIIDGQEDFTPYIYALERILKVRKQTLAALSNSFFAGMAATEEMERQVDHFISTP